MRKNNFKMKAVILAAFLLGTGASFVARHYLPLVLAEHLLAWTNLLALLVQIGVSVAVLLAALFIFRIGRRD